MGQSNWIMGVDVGGTFTDLVVWNPGSRKIVMVKVPTTPENQGVGLIKALEKSQVPLTEISRIVHGTTVATNTLIQRNGSACGLITTKGFRDILELRRGERPHRYGLKGDFEPLIPREWRLEVEERTTAEGEILKEVEEEQVLKAGKFLHEAGVEAVVISFLHSYLNPANEEKARQILKTFWPNEYILTSSEILSLPGEFERTSTAVIHAYVQPLIHRYLEGIEKELETHLSSLPPQQNSDPTPVQLKTAESQRSFQGRMVLMNSYGGVMSLSEARRFPASTILSGPAGGVIATCHLARQTGYRNLLSCDMGGTSCDVSAIVEGIPTLIDGKDLDFGLPLRLPMLDITTIGAGGGSIAWIDQNGYLRVGPQSAGAKPGPACYGRRGVKPTVTDANLILGRMNPQSPILKSSGILLNLQLAKEAVKNQVAASLGMSMEEAAFAILEVVNQNMAGLLRTLTISRGHNPRDFTLVAFGGAGPLHAAFLAQEVGIPRVIIPPYSGAFSAYGCMMAEDKYIFEQALHGPLNSKTLEKLSSLFFTHQNLVREKLKREDISSDHWDILCEIEMGYQGQSHGIWISHWDPQTQEDGLRHRFEEVYQRYFGEWTPEFPIEIKRFRTILTCPRLEKNRDIRLWENEAAEEVTPYPSRSSPSHSPTPGTRPVYFHDHFIDTPVYERSCLPSGTILQGPVLIEQEDSTTVVPPQVRVEIDPYGNLILTLE
jgi:N-methylhydantoinase A